MGRSARAPTSLATASAQAAGTLPALAVLLLLAPAGLAVALVRRPARPLGWGPEHGRAPPPHAR